MNNVLKMVYPDSSGAFRDASAELAFALKCYTGDGVVRDEVRAREILDRIHQRGRAFAAICLGFMQDNGIAVAADHEDAGHWYREAAVWFEVDAKAGDAGAWNNVGYLKAEGLGDEPDGPGALTAFSRAARGGCVAATYNMAVCHLNGIGVPQDAAQALPLLEQAAQKGDADAPFVLGQMLQAGLGVAPDGERAVSWFQLAAERGNPDAMSALGYAYGVGLGCEKNLRSSAHWFERAALHGDTYAQANLAMIWCQVNEMDSFSKGWQALSTASRGGDLNARYQLAQVLLRGVPCQKPDFSAAREVLRNLAGLGHPGGQHLLGMMLEDGLGGPPNDVEAAGWYQRAAEQGSANAQAALARLYAAGLGVPHDEGLAYYWYAQALPVENTHAWDELRALEARISPIDKARAEQLLADRRVYRAVDATLRLQ